MRSLQHPFAVDAVLEHSVVLIFGAPPHAVRRLVPPPLEVETHDGHGFVAVAMVRTRGLRPSALPPAFGRDFCLIGYRAFVRLDAADGRTYRGLYILHSDTDRRIMTVLGNLFTSYRYRLVDVAWRADGGRAVVSSRRGGLHVDASFQDPVELPAGSGFRSWKEARRFAGPMPYTFEVAPGARVLRVRGRRGSWKQRPLRVDRCEVGSLEALGLEAARLWSAFETRDVDYHWEKGQWVSARG